MTVPGYDLLGTDPGQPRRNRTGLVAVVVLALAAALGAFLAGGGGGIKPGGSGSRLGAAAIRAEAVAQGFLVSMRAGRPDLARNLLRDTGASLVRKDGVPALSGGHGVYRAAQAAACRTDTPLARAWLSSGDPVIGELGPKPCEAEWPAAVEPAPTAIPGVQPNLAESSTTWFDGGSEYSAVPVRGEPACATCHGDAAVSGVLGYVLASDRVVSDGIAWFWPASTGVLVLILGIAFWFREGATEGRA